MKTTIALFVLLLLATVSRADDAETAALKAKVRAQEIEIAELKKQVADLKAKIDAGQKPKPPAAPADKPIDGFKGLLDGMPPEHRVKGDQENRVYVDARNTWMAEKIVGQRFIATGESRVQEAGKDRYIQNIFATDMKWGKFTVHVTTRAFYGEDRSKLTNIEEKTIVKVTGTITSAHISWRQGNLIIDIDMEKCDIAKMSAKK